ncbi:MAG: dockerin type I domain-containing protein [Brevefilum sp.]
MGDTYTFTTAQPGYLNLQKSLTLNADLTLPPLRLLAGDVNGDELVDTADLEAIGAVFDASGSGLAADLNGDGVVNLQDLALAAGNYGLTPAEAYGDWLP